MYNMQSIMRLLWIPHDSINPTFALLAFDLVTADVDADAGPKSDSRRASLVNAPNRNLQNCSETLWKKKKPLSSLTCWLTVCY